MFWVRFPAAPLEETAKTPTRRPLVLKSGLALHEPVSSSFHPLSDMGLKEFVNDQTDSDETNDEEQLFDTTSTDTKSEEDDQQYTDADADPDMVSPGYSDDPITKEERERRLFKRDEPFASEEHQGNRYRGRLNWDNAPEWKHCPRCGALCPRGVDEETGEKKRHYVCTYPECGPGQFSYSRVYDGGRNPWYKPEKQAPFLWGWQRWF